MSRFLKDEGDEGERLAAEFLSKKGYKIIERNFRIRGGEIDIIAIHDNTLVFIEVKTRSSNKFGTPLESITPWKLKALIRTAQFYKIKHKNLPEGMRVDAVTVEYDYSGKPLIEHVENITS